MDHTRLSDLHVVSLLVAAVCTVRSDGSFVGPGRDKCRALATIAKRGVAKNHEADTLGCNGREAPVRLRLHR